MKKIFLLVSFLFFGLGFGQSLNPSDIDPTFNNYNIPFGNYYVEGYVRNVCIQNDNKIIVAEDNKLIRLDNNTLDPSFNCGSGFVSGFSSGLSISNMISFDNNDVLVLGAFSSYNNIGAPGLAKINNDGSLNTVFNTNLINSNICLVNSTFIAKNAINEIFIQCNEGKIFKLNEDGTLISTFNSYPINGQIRSMKFQNDGKIIVAGNFTSINGLTHNRLIRLNTNGTIDASFIAGVGFNDAVTAVEIQNNQKIIIGGNFTTYDGVVQNNLIRLNIDGSIDATFNSGTGFTSSSSIDVKKIKICADNKILIFGSMNNYQNQYVNNGIFRLNSDGTRDLSYFRSLLNINNIADYTNGSILVVGDFKIFENNQYVHRMIKLTDSGDFDNSFRNLHPPGFVGALSASGIPIHQQSDGKLLITRYGTTGASYNNNAVYGSIIRLMTDGTVDTTFSCNLSQFTKLAIQSDGKILIGGAANLRRLNVNGSLDATFPVLNIPSISSIAVLTNGKIVIGGNFLSFNGNSRNGFLVLNNDGTLDTTFPAIQFNVSTFNTGVRQVLIQTDGKILVTGDFVKVNDNLSYKKAIRLNNNGTIDTSFVYDTSLVSYTYGPFFELFSDGKIMVTLSVPLGTFASNLVRLNQNGSLDPTFSSPFNNNYICKVLQNNKVLVMGANSNLGGFVSRLNNNGTLDQSFSLSQLKGAFYGPSSVNVIIEQQNGKIVLGGDFKNYKGVNKYGIVQLMGEDYNFINGQNKFDDESDGCDINDFSFPNMKLKVESGTNFFDYISDISGNYNIANAIGNHTITPTFENPSYFNASPTSISVSFPTQASPVIQDFCITPNGLHPDLEITLLPLTVARPGFEAKYRLVYKNKGNQLQSGIVNFNFNDAVLNFVSATTAVSSQTLNNLNWNFTNLMPLETREITITLTVNSPTATPPVNSGFVLNYTTSVSSTLTDEMPNDNTFSFNHTVVNSFDPNDKTCLEGATIANTKIGDYVHYMIRFENTGSYNAQNITVKDIIDTTKYDINTLLPTSGSHPFITRILEGNRAEFYFENINLPFADATNDGYVAFKIKTKSTLLAGDSFSNSAEIYFDYNYPITTNTATTTITALSNQDFIFNDYFSVYPNPVESNLNIAKNLTIEITSITIYNTLGQIVIAIPNAREVQNIDVSSLKSGNYFVKINSDKGTSNTKFIKM